MKASIHIPKKTYVISVSLMKGCYRHIKIASNKTLDDLSRAILSAFDFDNDHLHAFFMDNKMWSDEDSYYAEAEYGQRDSSKYKLGQIGLESDKKFIYLFDFGDEWRFSCKVLKVIDGVCEPTEIVRSVGDAPEQYPDYDDSDEEYDEGEEDEDFALEPYPDSLYAAAFRFRDTKLWKKLKKEDIFAIKLSDDKGDLIYCSVTDNKDGFPALMVFPEGFGLHEYLKQHILGKCTPKEYIEYICLQSYLSCELQSKDVIDTASEMIIRDYAERNGISLRGKYSFPIIAHAIPGHFPFIIENEENRKCLERALNAAVLLSGFIERLGKKELGFGQKDVMPLLEYTSEDGYTFSEIGYPEAKEPNYSYPSTRKIRKKLPHHGVYECDIVYTPTPVPDDMEDISSPVSYAVTFMAADIADDGDYFYTDLFSGYELNSDDMLECVVNDFKENGFLPEEMRVIDKRTYYFLLDFCEKNDIKLTEVTEFEVFEEVRSFFINELIEQTDEELGDEKSAEEMYNEICDTIRELSEEQLALMPKEMFEQFMEADILPDDLQAKLRRSRIKF